MIYQDNYFDTRFMFREDFIEIGSVVPTLELCTEILRHYLTEIPWLYSGNPNTYISNENTKHFVVKIIKLLYTQVVVWQITRVGIVWSVVRERMRWRVFVERSKAIIKPCTQCLDQLIRVNILSGCRNSWLTRRQWWSALYQWRHPLYAPPPPHSVYPR